MKELKRVCISEKPDAEALRLVLHYALLILLLLINHKYLNGSTVVDVLIMLAAALVYGLNCGVKWMTKQEAITYLVAEKYEKVAKEIKKAVATCIEKKPQRH